MKGKDVLLHVFLLFFALMVLVSLAGGALVTIHPAATDLTLRVVPTSIAVLFLLMLISAAIDTVRLSIPRLVTDEGTPGSADLLIADMASVNYLPVWGPDNRQLIAFEPRPKSVAPAQES